MIVQELQTNDYGIITTSSYKQVVFPNIFFSCRIEIHVVPCHLNSFILMKSIPEKRTLIKDINKLIKTCPASIHKYWKDDYM